MTEIHRDACWHPSGHWFAVVSCARIYRVIVERAAPSEEPEPLTRDLLPGKATNPNFSPDGRLLAFNAPVDGKAEIFLLKDNQPSAAN